MPDFEISVVVPTLDRTEVLLDTLRDLLAQDSPSFEIIVVDQSDKPNAAAIALLTQSRVPSRYFKARFRGLPQARNYGWQVARGEYVLYVDDDIRTGPTLLSEHVAAQRRSGGGVVAGAIDEARGNKESVHPPGAFNWWTATPIRNFSKSDAGWCVHPPGGNFSVRRDLLEQSGGVDEALAVGAALHEETELALRLRAYGGRTWFAPTARLTHLAAPSGGTRVRDDWPRYMYGLAHNRSIVIWRHVGRQYRLTAIGRLLLLALSYSRLDRSLRPLQATLLGIRDGRRKAMAPRVGAQLLADECTSS